MHRGNLFGNGHILYPRSSSATVPMTLLSGCWVISLWVRCSYSLSFMGPLNILPSETDRFMNISSTMIRPSISRTLGSLVQWLSLAIMLVAPVALQAQPNPFLDGPPRQLVDDGVSSEKIEIVPVISPDGQTLYFDRKYDSANVGGVTDEDDIYYSTLGPDGKWSPARNIGSPLNTKGSDVLFWISSDGTIALVYNGELALKGTGLGIAHKVDGAWQRPRAIAIEGTDLGATYYATLTPDMRRLIVALQPDSTNEDNLDLYYAPAASLDLLHWGSPVSLGSVINTQFFEGAPFMASDNRTLYFSSAGLSGMGSADIFMTRRIGDGWGHWSDPVDLGPRVNTPGFDASISIRTGGDVAYISSFADINNTDIYSVQLPELLLPEKLVVLHGSFNAGGRGVSGLIRAVQRPGGKEVGSTVSAIDGSFTLFLPPGGEYTVSGWMQDQGEAAATVDCRSGELERRVALVIGGATPPGQENATPMSVQIDGFAVGTDELPSSATPQLQKLYDNLRQRNFAGVVVSVAGHTDSKGEHLNNQELSDRRAGAVLRWLVIKGVPPNMINVKGYGDSQPVGSNDTEEGRRRNRRVDISVVVEGKGG